MQLAALYNESHGVVSGFVPQEPKEAGAISEAIHHRATKQVASIVDGRA